MQIKKIETKEYTLSAYEMYLIKKCLTYCLHRIKYHIGTGIIQAMQNRQEIDDITKIKNQI